MVDLEASGGPQGGCLTVAVCPQYESNSHCDETRHEFHLRIPSEKFVMEEKIFSCWAERSPGFGTREDTSSVSSDDGTIPISRRRPGSVWRRHASDETRTGMAVNGNSVVADDDDDGNEVVLLEEIVGSAECEERASSIVLSSGGTSGGSTICISSSSSEEEEFDEVRILTPSRITPPYRRRWGSPRWSFWMLEEKCGLWTVVGHQIPQATETALMSGVKPLAWSPAGSSREASGAAEGGRRRVWMPPADEDGDESQEDEIGKAVREAVCGKGVPWPHLKRGRGDPEEDEEGQDEEGRGGARKRIKF